ncbi:glycosyltransferase family 2 protein [Inquilinus limosus]|uniref:glycosyltransferase family 2 protein n=1 Tax=Inquilinus limosus TaxID=171674 RepID=UPI0009DBCDCF|nr:glycosyltransferase family 2 protein [Inquilinus limosus]
MSRHRVSIGLPVYNGENYIAEAINSVLAQTYADFELVICDNGSTDRTEEICRRYADADPRIRYHRNPRNLGASANFGRTFELATGEYFRWLAHDDVLAPTYLERCVAALDREPDAILAQPLVGIIDTKGAILSVHDNDVQRACSPLVSERFAVLVKHPRRCWEAFGLIRRDVLARTSLLAPYSCSDVVLCIELGLLGRFVLVPEPLFLNREHPERFARAVLVDRTATWRWWNNSDRARLIDLCPTWLIQANTLRAIRKHVSNRGDRYGLYLALLRHVLTGYTLSRLIIEPVTAADPRILMAGRRVKRWLQARRVPDFGAAGVGSGPEVPK